MPNRLSRLFSARSSKDKEAEAEAEAESARLDALAPPPSYAAEAPNYDPNDIINPPDETAGFSALSINDQSGDIPQVSQCIAHLKVLECFYRLRQKVGSSDGLFGLDDLIIREKELPEEGTGQLLAKIAEKRWGIYVSRAADRFEAWSASLFPGQRMLRNEQLESKHNRLCEPDGSTAGFRIDRDNLPPIDVLMVWHAYMLNPRAYLEDCLRLQRMPMWHAGFPWQSVADAIDSSTFSYDAGEAASTLFASKTGLSWDNLDDTSPQSVDCPGCGKNNEVEYTTCSRSTFDTYLEGNHGHTEDALNVMLSNGHGYCDKDFEYKCSNCDFTITHDGLKARKFCDAIERSIESDVPMGGTILGTKGLPWAFQKVTDHSCRSVCKFPNDLIKAGLGSSVFEKVNADSYTLSMNEMRTMTEQMLSDKTFFKLSRGGRGGFLSRDQRVGIRRMMSRYWDNHSPFALDLVGAVIRQGSFIEKMHNIDWLHSPALRNTMKRLIVKYERFVNIMKDRYHMAVPTLDVDLAWHTHQLSPPSYMQYTVHTTGQFIDHDDKVAEAKLNDAFAWTTKTYQKTYGEPYSECTCWYCEAIRESQTSSVSRLFNSKNASADDQLHSSEQDPRKSVHISAHNAVRPTDTEYERLAAGKAEMLDKHYKQACERAKKKGRKPPSRDDYYYSDAWGYPCYIPAYSPYMAWGMYTPMYYPATPGCMALGAGSYGNCCSGTCGAGVAAGGCAGAGGMTGGCAGGVAGGCGAGAAGGGGCGGGGGGCGGGGGGGGGCGGGGGG